MDAPDREPPESSMCSEAAAEAEPATGDDETSPGLEKESASAQVPMPQANRAQSEQEGADENAPAKHTSSVELGAGYIDGDAMAKVEQMLAKEMANGQHAPEATCPCLLGVSRAHGVCCPMFPVQQCIYSYSNLLVTAG